MLHWQLSCLLLTYISYKSQHYHYFPANWDGFHDNETDLWGYTWAVGTRECDDDIVEPEDPHSHLADRSLWSHQGYATDMVLTSGRKYFTNVQALNDVNSASALNR